MRTTLWATVCKVVRPMLFDRCPVCLSCPVCNVDLLWPNSWMDQDELGTEVGLGPGHIALAGVSAPPKKGHSPPPNFQLMSIVAKRLNGLRCHLVWR